VRKSSRTLPSRVESLPNAPTCSFPFPRSPGFLACLNFTAPERRYNPEVRDFLAELLGYPKDRVVTEEHQGEGFPDILLLTEKGDPWVVGDFKKDNSLLLNPAKADGLWAEKRKYVTGFTRYVLFLTPHCLQVRNPLGEVLLQLDLPRRPPPPSGNAWPSLPGEMPCTRPSGSKW
jgi:hypothetical protein